VWEDRTSLLGNINQIRKVNDLEIEPALEQAQAQGCDVHRYTTQWFESWGGTVFASRRELWNDIGSYYALVIVVSPHLPTASASGSNGNTIRYQCADSTNGQLLVVGGGDGNGATGWADTTMRGQVDFANVQWNGACATTNARLVTLPSMSSIRDTVWLFNIFTGARMHVLPTGIDTVFRLYSILTGTGTAAGVQANLLDWHNIGTPGTNDAESLRVYTPVQDDSVSRIRTRADSAAGGATEYLGPAWKVRFHLATQNLPNSLGSAAPRDVYWFKTMNGVFPARTKTDMLWGLICRFTAADPIRWAYENDDMADQSSTNNTSRNTYAGGSKTGASAADSVIALLRNRYGVNLLTAVVNPHHAYQYATAGESPWYESSWPATLARVSYWQKNSMAWIFHAHDTTSWVAADSSVKVNTDLTAGPQTLNQAGYGKNPVMLGGNLVGRFGGYATGNTASSAQGGGTVQYYTDRVASRWDPLGLGIDSTGGDLRHSRSLNAFRAGIVQRLAYSDSIRRILCPQCPLPPYLNFPSNQVMPVNSRKNRPSRPGADAAWTMYGTGSVDSLLCPMDSLFWAFDYGLNGAKTIGTGTIFLRGTFDDPKTQWVGWDRDSFPAWVPWLYPRESWTVRIGGRLIQAIGINSFLIGASAKNNYYTDTGANTNRALGFFNGIIHAEAFDVVKGESYNVDLNNFNNGGPPIQGSSSRMFRPQQSSRVIYQHGFSGGYPINGNGSYDIEYFEDTAGQRIHAISVIAGRPATRCVAPWTVYGHD
jgi:hypothetical protein